MSSRYDQLHKGYRDAADAMDYGARLRRDARLAAMALNLGRRSARSLSAQDREMLGPGITSETMALIALLRRSPEMRDLLEGDLLRDMEDRKRRAEKDAQDEAATRAAKLAERASATCGAETPVQESDLVLPDDFMAIPEPVSAMTVGSA